jgi:hypothetical protein
VGVVYHSREAAARSGVPPAKTFDLTKVCTKSRTADRIFRTCSDPVRVFGTFFSDFIWAGVIKFKY